MYSCATVILILFGFHNNACSYISACKHLLHLLFKYRTYGRELDYVEDNRRPGRYPTVVNRLWPYIRKFPPATVLTVLSFWDSTFLLNISNDNRVDYDTRNGNDLTIPIESYRPNSSPLGLAISWEISANTYSFFRNLTLIGTYNQRFASFLAVLINCVG